MRGIKMSAGQNPSQDSAFGSMTDGEQSIASSSIRLSSFQSISSPIDEGVEDISGSVLDLTSMGTHMNFSSNISSPCRDARGSDPGNLIARSTSDSVALEKNGMMAMLTGGGDCNVGHTLEPPKILVNDQSSFYTTSPSKTGGATIEVFSQKYRVSSFEDMSLRKTSLKNVNKLAFRSLEEERRIDSAFQPVVQPSTTLSASQRVFTANNEKFKKLTHAAFSRKITTTKERHTKWKNSILARKNVLIKSNESLLDGAAGSSSRMNKRVNSTNELFTGNRYDSSESIGNSSLPDTFPAGRSNPRKSHSERYLFSLCQLKQTAINDYDEHEEDHARGYDDGFGVNRSDIVSFIDETSSSEEAGSSSEDTSSSPSHRDVCQFIGGLVDADRNGGTGCTEENTPLLNGMEMSPISPVETDALL